MPTMHYSSTLNLLQIIILQLNFLFSLVYEKKKERRKNWTDTSFTLFISSSNAFLIPADLNSERNTRATISLLFKFKSETHISPRLYCEIWKIVCCSPCAVPSPLSIKINCTVIYFAITRGESLIWNENDEASLHRSNTIIFR